MGYKNALRVYVLHGHHRGNAHRLLTYMALRAFDATGDDDPLFIGTREEMAFALGLYLPDAPARDDMSAQAADARQARSKGLQSVSNALRGLYSTGTVLAPKVRAGPEAKLQYLLKIFPSGTSGKLVENPVRNTVEKPKGRKQTLSSDTYTTAIVDIYTRETLSPETYTPTRPS